MLEVLIDNRNGNVWDISEIVSSITWKTSRIGRPSSVDIVPVKGGIYENIAVQYNPGDIVRIRKENTNVFYGYIFEVSTGKDENLKIKAYDQLRYLLANDTYIFSNATAAQIIKRIADDFGLQAGQLADTGYQIPTLVEDNKKLLDIICKALDMTLIATGRNYVFYDNFGQLALRNVEDMLLNLIIGDNSLAYDYDYKRSIDSDTYNRIKIVQDNKDKGKREVYIAQDSANIAKWGVLQLYHVADENMNEAQINELLNTLATVKNREHRTLRINAIGDIRIRAGSYINIVIDKLGIKQPFLVDECTHSFDGPADHTMTLDLKVI